MLNALLFMSFICIDRNCVDLSHRDDKPEYDCPSLRPEKENVSGLRGNSGEDRGVSRKLFSKDCYKDLGCFPTDGPFGFHILYRPLVKKPQSPKKIGTKFLLFTRKNKHKEQTLDPSHLRSIQRSNYDSSKVKTFLIIHGLSRRVLNASNPYDWVTDVKLGILHKIDVNIIEVDWSKTHRRPVDIVTRYVQAAANARVVGRQVGNLLLTLNKTFGLDLAKAHIIGLSLGAHIAGYAGDWMNGRLERITGLDPAGPLFYRTAQEVRLDPNDAKFVDVIHTSGCNTYMICLGMLQEVGHVDIYVDNLKGSQGCTPPIPITMNIPSPKDTLKRLLTYMFHNQACLHYKSADVYLQSLKEKCPFTAFRCNKFIDYMDADCTKCDKPGIDCTPAGYAIDNYRHKCLYKTKFTLTTTNNRSALCMYHWLMSVNVYKIEDTSKKVSFHLSVQGRKGFTTKLEKPRTYPFRKGDHRLLLQYEKDPVTIRSFSFHWQNRGMFHHSIGGNRKNLTFLKNKPSLSIGFLKEPRIWVDKFTFVPIHRIDPSERKRFTRIFCNPSKTNEIGEEKVIELSERNLC